MYRDYINMLGQQKAMMVNTDDSLVSLELRWLGLYDFFFEELSRTQNLEPTEEQREYGRIIDERRDEMYREFYEGPVPHESGGAVLRLLAYVAQYHRLYLFQYFWGFKDPNDNGLLSHNAEYSPGALEVFLENLPMGVYPVTKKLRVFKTYEQARDKIGGWSSAGSPRPDIVETTTMDELHDVIEKLYGKKRKRRKR